MAFMLPGVLPSSEVGPIDVETGSEVDPKADLVTLFEALANPVRVALLHRLARPAFMPELAKEFGLTRQALKRHIEALEAVDLVQSQRARRGALPAQQYAASPQGLFAFKEGVLAIALPAAPRRTEGARTRPGATPSTPRHEGPGFLLAHGDVPGRWFPLSRGQSWIIGRDPRDEVGLTYDPFASLRHAMVSRSDAQEWTLTDLHSTNGTLLDFVGLTPGEPHPLRPGSVVSVGRSRLIFQGGKSGG